MNDTIDSDVMIMPIALLTCAAGGAVVAPVTSVVSELLVAVISIPLLHAAEKILPHQLMLYSVYVSIGALIASPYIGYVIGAASGCAVGGGVILSLSGYFDQEPETALVGVTGESVN